jgi:Zn-dependent metalloprotease
MGKHAFLSEEWLTEVMALQEQYRSQMPAPAVKMKLTQVVTGVPFGGGSVEIHIDTTSGQAQMGKGALEAPDVSVTTDYVTAKMLFVDNNQQAAMQAFMQGKIKAQGDMAKLMVPPAPKNDAQKEFEGKVKEITE